MSLPKYWRRTKDKLSILVANAFTKVKIAINQLAICIAKTSSQHRNGSITFKIESHILGRLRKV